MGDWLLIRFTATIALLMGITVAHADETAPTLVNQQIQPVQVNQPAITDTSGHPANEQLNSTVLPAKTAPTATTESTASSPAQAVQPNVTDDQHSSSHHPVDWSHNYERVIWITYRDHYDTNGGASSNYHREEIIQMAENGHWEEVNWYPPEGTFPPGVKVPPVHFAAASPTESANQRWNVEYFMRSVDIQTATGRQTISQVYTIHNSQTVNIPEIEIPNSSIPAGYHPRISPLAIQNDKVIERGGHYYLTGATLTFDNIGVVYHGAGGTTAPGTITFAEKVILSAPINLVYQDLSGKVYNAYGDQYPAYAASYQDVAQVDYGQTLSANQLYADAQKYLNQYVTSVFDEPDSNYQIYGYFDPAGKLHPIQSPADYPGFTDAQAGSDGLTYQLAIVYRRHGKVDDPVTKTRTIIVNMPDGRQEKTIQEVTLAQFADYDGITGEELSTPTWKVLTGDQPDSNDDWETLTAGNHDWQAFIVPSIAGYTPSLTQVASQTITDSSQDQTIKVNYQADSQSVKVIYKDGDKVVKTTELTGTTGQTVKVALNLPTHYTLLNEPASTYTFRASGNQYIIVELGHQMQATDREKIVTRQIIITDPTGHIVTITQTARLNQSGVLDLVTNQTDWDKWTTSHWDSFVVPRLAGYTPSQGQLAAQAVTSTTENQVIKINYQADSQRTRVVDKDGNRIVKIENLAGKTGQTVNVVISAPDHYQIINHPATNYTFQASGNQDIIVELGHQMQATHREKTVTRRIIVTDPAGKSTTTTQKAILHQTGVLDLVTQRINWDDWTTDHWASFVVPLVAGYTPSQAQVARHTVTNRDQDIVVKIHYQADDQNVKIVYVTPDGQVISTANLHGQTDTRQVLPLDVPTGYQLVAGQQIPQTIVMKPQMANIMIMVTKVVSHKEPAGANKVIPGESLPGGSKQSSLSGRPLSGGQQNQQYKELPRTGNKDASVTGLVLVTTLSMLGFGYRKRNSLEK